MVRIRFVATVAPPIAEGLPNAGMNPVHMYLTKSESDLSEGPRQTRLSERVADDLLRRITEANDGYRTDNERMFKGYLPDGRIPEGETVHSWFDLKVSTRGKVRHYSVSEWERLDFSARLQPVWDALMEVRRTTLAGLKKEERTCRGKEWRRESARSARSTASVGRSAASGANATNF